MGLKKQGFTLVELVVVIIILAIVGVATTTYISTGVSIYSDISERDRGLNSVRFAMERMRRDLLNALPNSLVVSDLDVDNVDIGRCLTFTPIKASSVYSYDFPIAPLSASSASIAAIDDDYNYVFETGDRAAVYLLDADQLTNENTQLDALESITAISGESITFTRSSASFSLGSPSQRLYIIGSNKSYYFNDSEELVLATSCDATGSVMAKEIDGEFNVQDATLQRNGLAKVTFMLTFDGQEVPIEQTLHVSNVP